jgi:hypothetical protein
MDLIEDALRAHQIKADTTSRKAMVNTTRFIAKHVGFSCILTWVNPQTLQEVLDEVEDTGAHRCTYQETPDGMGCPTCLYC